MLKNFVSNRSSFAKNIIALVSATALAQVINFGFSIVLTRIYTPTAFGTVTLFSSFVAFLLVVCSGKYDLATVASRDKEDAKGLTSLGIHLTVLLVFIALIAAFLIYVVPIKFYNGSPVRNWLYLVPASLFFLGGFQVFWMWNVREKRFKRISLIRPIEALVNNSTAFFASSLHEIGLLLGVLTGQFFSFSIITAFSFKKDGKSIFFQPFHHLQKLAVKYSEFPKVNILQGFVDMFQFNALVIILSAYYDPKYLGYYALCLRVLQVPVRLIVAPVSNVFFSEAAEMHHNNKPLSGLVNRTIKRIGLFTLPFFIVILIAGPMIFSFVFGKQWESAGIYARIFAFWFFLDMIRSPISQVAFVLGKQRQLLYLSLLAGFLLITIAIISAHYFANPAYVLGLVSVSQVFAMLLIIGFIINISRKSIVI